MKTPKPRYKTAAIRGLLNAAFDGVGLVALYLSKFPGLCDSLGSILHSGS
jgi:hypothetical protein